MVGVVVVESEVDACTDRVIVADVRRQELRRDATCEAVVEHIREIARHGDVARRELAQLVVVGVGVSHLAVVHILSRHSPRSTFAHGAVERGARRCGSRHVCHDVQTDCLVAYRREQGRVAEHQRGVVFYDRHVVATHCCCVCADRQTQEVVCCLALLRR